MQQRRIGYISHIEGDNLTIQELQFQDVREYDNIITHWHPIIGNCFIVALKQVKLSKNQLFRVVHFVVKGSDASDVSDTFIGEVDWYDEKGFGVAKTQCGRLFMSDYGAFKRKNLVLLNNAIYQKNKKRCAAQKAEKLSENNFTEDLLPFFEESRLALRWYSPRFCNVLRWNVLWKQLDCADINSIIAFLGKIENTNKNHILTQKYESAVFVQTFTAWLQQQQISNQEEEQQFTKYLTTAAATVEGINTNGFSFKYTKAYLFEKWIRHEVANFEYQSLDEFWDLIKSFFEKPDKDYLLRDFTYNLKCCFETNKTLLPIFYRWITLEIGADRPNVVLSQKEFCNCLANSNSNIKDVFAYENKTQLHAAFLRIFPVEKWTELLKEVKEIDKIALVNFLYSADNISQEQKTTLIDYVYDNNLISSFTDGYKDVFSLYAPNIPQEQTNDFLCKFSENQLVSIFEVVDKFWKKKIWEYLFYSIIKDKYFIVFDIESDGEKIYDFCCCDNKGKEIKDLKSFERALKKADLVIGHNIKQWDIPILEKCDISFKGKLIWDTLEIEAILSPLQNSYALKTAHKAKEDTLLTKELFENQCLRALACGVWAQLPISPFLQPLSKVFKAIPQDFTEGFSSTHFFISTDTIQKNPFTAKLAPNDFIVANTFVWHQFIKVPQVVFCAKGMEDYTHVLDAQKVAQSPLDIYLQIALLAYHEQCTTQAITPNRVNLSPWVRVWLEANASAQTFFVAPPKMLKPSDRIYVLDEAALLGNFYRRALFAKGNVVRGRGRVRGRKGGDRREPVRSTEGEAVARQHPTAGGGTKPAGTPKQKLKFVRNTYSWFYPEISKLLFKQQIGEISQNDFSDMTNKENLWIRIGGNKYISLNNSQIAAVTKLGKHQPYLLFWLEHILGSTNFIWAGKLKDYYYNIGQKLRPAAINSCHLSIITTPKHNNLYQRLNPETPYQSHYWTGQLYLLEQLLSEKKERPVVFLVPDEAQVASLIKILGALNFKLSYSGHSLVKKIEKLQEITVLALSDFSNLLAYKKLLGEKSILFVIDSLPLSEMALTTMLLAENQVERKISLNEEKDDDAVSKTSKKQSVGIDAAIENAKELVDYYRACLHEINPDNQLCLLDVRLEDNPQLPKRWNAHKIELKWASEEEYLKLHAVIKNKFHSPQPFKININQITQIQKTIEDVFIGGNTLSDAQEQYFDYIIQSKGDLLVSLPTGGGKSVLFQGPALYRGVHTNRMSLVITPLRALMEDQIYALGEKGFFVTAEYINRDSDNVRNIYRRIAGGEILLLYVTPERFRVKRFRRALEMRMEMDKGLEYCIFDEAHCITQWGSEFRPDYYWVARHINNCRKGFDTSFPVLLFSATVSEIIFNELKRIFS